MSHCLSEMSPFLTFLTPSVLTASHTVLSHDTTPPPTHTQTHSCLFSEDLQSAVGRQAFMVTPVVCILLIGPSLDLTGN